LTGQWVTVEGSREPVEGEVLGIDEEGALRLRARGGREVRAIAGDVTLKKRG
jgi:biotin-(acetyl-CoA carboxylase) ligase